MTYMGIGIAVITLLIALVSYSIYIRDVVINKTHPHGITWAVWGTLNSFIFYQQIIHGAGPGAWVTGMAALANLVIFFLSFKYGEKNITRFDWLCLFLVAVAFSIWISRSDDTIAILMAIAIFIIGLLPTIRKVSGGKSHETIITFFLNSFKFLLALFALQSVTLITAAYPVTLFIVNLLFALYLVYEWQKRHPMHKRSKRI